MDLSRLACMALGVTFVWAGVAKLADARWPGSAAAFGVPGVIAAVIAPVELVLGAALVTLPGRLVASVAMAVLVVYTYIVVREVRSEGAAPPCACFGGLNVRPVSWRTVARNVALLALAVLALAG
ncbi:MAG TPA: MauE/DoxX family redox-associated membrane protein [Acidimicrobiales bacterium]|nr:MauE/DoxX family redox-associated membrane protein [Acidimicrobiales bacterium]